MFDLVLDRCEVSSVPFFIVNHIIIVCIVRSICVVGDGVLVL